MRLPVILAWFILGLAFFTSGLLRGFHEQTPTSPFVAPIVGNLLFAALLVVLLVAAREWRRGAVPGRGIRLGSLTPILLMLLLEKWGSLSVYVPVFDWIVPASSNSALADAQFRGFAGLGLILICLLISRFSAPTARKTWRRARPSRFPIAMLQLVGVVGGSYALLGGLAWLFGGDMQLRWPRISPLLLWILAGQAVLAFAEELYYRGLLLCEIERLAPRLGARSPAARRWIALGFTAVLFGMEHLTLAPSWDEIGRQMVFTVALGLLFGLLVMVSANLHFVGGVHAWINWLLLGAAPYFADAEGNPVLAPGTYIGLAMILAFVTLYVGRRRRASRQARSDRRVAQPST